MTPFECVLVVWSLVRYVFWKVLQFLFVYFYLRFSLFLFHHSYFSTMVCTSVGRALMFLIKGGDSSPSATVKIFLCDICASEFYNFVKLIYFYEKYVWMKRCLFIMFFLWFYFFFFVLFFVKNFQCCVAQLVEHWFFNQRLEVRFLSQQI